MTGEFEIVIRAGKGKLSDNLTGLWQYKDLIKLLVRRDFSILFKQTVLGPLWLLLNRLFSSIVQAFIFGGLAGLSTDGMPLLLFYMAGNVVWELFSKSTSIASNTFIENSYIMGKVYFPRLVIPISQVISTFINSLIPFTMLLGFFVFYLITGTAVHLSFWILLLPVLLIQTALLGLSIGLCVSALTTKYRDLVHGIGIVLQLWMYLTPVVYPLSTATGIFHTVLLLNPMTAVIENFRFCLMGSGALLVENWIISIVLTIGLFFLGATLFSHTERTFIDTI